MRSLIQTKCLWATLALSSTAMAAPPPNGASFIKAGAAEIESIRIDAHKTILRYPSRNRAMEINVMKVDGGRSPLNPDRYIYNTLVHFMIYVTKGHGTFYVDDASYEVGPGDVLDVPPKTRFAVSGENLEYVTIESPSFFLEQSHIVDGHNEVREN